MEREVRIARSPLELPDLGPRAITIGNFDGVHIGHRQVLKSIVQTGLTTTVVTFDPHPRVFFGADLAEITTLEHRLELLAAAGIDEVLVLRFDAEMAALPPDAWVRRYLKPIDARLVAVGEQFRFGRDRGGDVELLRRMGLEVRSVGLVTDASSTRIRDLVQRGELSQAADLLGRCHQIDADVLDAVRQTEGTTLVLQPAGRQPVLPPSGRYAARLDERPAVVARERIQLRAKVRDWDGSVGDRLRIALARVLQPRLA